MARNGRKADQLIQNGNNMRREVLNAFKRLHRARQLVFQGDQRALTECRKQINEHFRKNKDVRDEQEVSKMVQLALAVENELRTNVIQAVEKSEGIYELRITEDTTKLDNVSFDQYAFETNKCDSLPKDFNSCCRAQSGQSVIDEINKK